MRERGESIGDLESKRYTDVVAHSNWPLLASM
jgi:hypothetical protein